MKKELKRTNLTSLVLPGAITKGAYEAGVIEELVKNNVPIDRIVATSSGALNAVALAAGIRSGHQHVLARKLVEAWIERGGWTDSLRLNPLDLIRGKGLSSHDGLLDLLRSVIRPVEHSMKNDIELRIIVTPLLGTTGNIGEKKATTYETVIDFTGEDFDTEEGLEKIFQATIAACSFPGIFSPVNLKEIGPCVDGGAVNNAPIRYALDYSDVTQIIMPVPFPSIIKPPDSLRGQGLLLHLIEILINERLYRDLKAAEHANANIEKMEELVRDDVISEKQYKKLQEVFHIRKVSVLEVRPHQNMSVGAFSGFFSKKDRIRLVEEGREAMKEVLKQYFDKESGNHKSMGSNCLKEHMLSTEGKESKIEIHGTNVL